MFIINNYSLFKSKESKTIITLMVKKCFPSLFPFSIRFKANTELNLLNPNSEVKKSYYFNTLNDYST